MKKFLVILCMVLCLAGCSRPIEESVEDDNIDVVTEIQTKIQDINSLLAKEGTLDDIREVIATGTVEDSPITFFFDDLFLETPSLTADFVPQKDTLKVGYNWKDKTYMCLFTCSSEKEYAYIIANFDENLVCYNFYASAIMTYPYVSTPDDTSTSETPSDEYAGGYIPFPTE